MKSSLYLVTSSLFSAAKRVGETVREYVTPPLISGVSWANRQLPEPIQGVLANAGNQASAAFRQLTSFETIGLLTEQPQLRELGLASLKQNATYAAWGLGTNLVMYQMMPNDKSPWHYSAVYYTAASLLMIVMWRQQVLSSLNNYALTLSTSKVANQVAEEKGCHDHFPFCGCGQKQYLNQTFNGLLQTKKTLNADIHHTIRLIVANYLIKLASFLPYSTIPVTFLKWITAGQSFLDYKLSPATCTQHRQAAFNQNNFFVLALGGLFYLTIEGATSSMSKVIGEDNAAIRAVVTALVSQYFITAMILNREALPGKGKSFDVFYNSPLLAKEPQQWMSVFIQWAKSCLPKTPDKGMNLSALFNAPVVQGMRDIAQVVLLYPNLGFWQNMMQHDAFYLFVQHYEDKLKLLPSLDDHAFLIGVASFFGGLYTRLPLKKIMFMASDKTITPLKIAQDIIALCLKRDVTALKKEIRSLLSAKEEADLIRHTQYSPSAEDSEAEADAFKEFEIFLLDDSLSEEDFIELLTSDPTFNRLKADDFQDLIDNAEPVAGGSKVVKFEGFASSRFFKDYQEPASVTAELAQTAELLHRVESPAGR